MTMRRHEQPTRRSALFCYVLAIISASVMTPAQSFSHSYAIVIGIDKYTGRDFTSLSYPVSDAKAIRQYLSTQQFEIVSELYDAKASKTAITSALQSLARRVRSNDRVVVFFAGHGYTEQFGDVDYGYLVPADATGDSATYLSMDEVRALAGKMNAARHQLWIMDACYGGQLATRATRVDPSIPSYIDEITKRVARQVITAGGANQQVLDRGPRGNSVFTGALLDALSGSADTNGDGFVTYPELLGYVEGRASNDYQTPAGGVLPGHASGEFVFRSPKGTSAVSASPGLIGGEAREAGLEVLDLVLSARPVQSKGEGINVGLWLGGNISDRNAAQLNRLAQTLEAAGGRVTAVAAVMARHNQRLKKLLDSHKGAVAVYQDGRDFVLNAKGIDCVLMIAFMNQPTHYSPMTGASLPADDWRELAISIVTDLGRHVYVFADHEVWSGGEMVKRKAKDRKVGVWAGAPTASDIQDFFSFIRSGSPTGGLIR